MQLVHFQGKQHFRKINMFTHSITQRSEHFLNLSDFVRAQRGITGTVTDGSIDCFHSLCN